MIPDPLVSVCIPAYLGGSHIGETIRSVLAQTYREFELVIVDDNSRDGTAGVVESSVDPRIRFLRNAINLGPEGNWNRCLTEARGKYFKLLPHDDLLHPDCLRQQVDVLETDTAQELALVFSARTMINAASMPQTVRGCPGHGSGRIASKRLVRQCVRRGTNLIGEPGCVLMRRELAEKVGPFSSGFPYVTDLEYWFRLLSHGDAWYLDDALASFRISRSQWSVVIGRGQSKDFSRFTTCVAGRSEYGISALDLALGQGMARINNVLRLLYYRFVLE